MPESTHSIVRRLRRLRRPVRAWLAFRKEASIDEQRWRARLARQLAAVAPSAHIIDRGTIRRSFDDWLAVWPAPYRSGRAWTSPLASLVDAAAPRVDRLRDTARDLGPRIRSSITAWIAVRRAAFQDRPSLRSLAAPVSDAVSARMHRLSGRASDQSRTVHRSVAIWIAMHRAPYRDAWGWKSVVAPVADVVHSSGGQTAVGLGVGLVAAALLGLAFAAPVPAASDPAQQAFRVELMLAVEPAPATISEASGHDPASTDPETAPSRDAPMTTPAPSPTPTPRPPAPDQRPTTEAAAPRPPAATQRPTTPTPEASSPTPSPSPPPPPATVEATPTPTPTPDPGSGNSTEPPRPGKPEKTDKPPKPTKPPKPG
jgi:hypothetical protein